MLQHNIIMKFLLLFIFCLTNVLAVDVLVAKKKIPFKSKIELNNLRVKKVKKTRRSCIPVTLNEISQTHYISKHYINPGAIICEKDIKAYKKDRVLFNFGNIEIEKEGRVVGETKKYIRVKKPNGRIEKIYKDGRLK